MDDTLVIDFKNDVFNANKLKVNDVIKFIIIMNCRFGNLINKPVSKHIQFENCTFNDINLYNVLQDIIFINCNIGKLIINSTNGILDSKISIINDFETSIGTIEVCNTNLKDSFSIINRSGKYSTKIHFLTILNTEFEKLFELNNIEIVDDCNLNSIVFKDLTLFDECIFHVNTIFKYVIFDNFVNFRNSSFLNGLNLDYSSHKEIINFHKVKNLDSNDSKDNTTQETYRIIKHNFEQLGNKVEANKYHALELEQKRISLNKKKCKTLSDIRDMIVFNLHGISSSHSTNWFYAFCWILVIGVCTNLGLEKFIDNFQFEWINTFKYINITHYDECLKENPLILLLNKVSLGYLYYQFLMSVRKDTRK